MTGANISSCIILNSACENFTQGKLLSLRRKVSGGTEIDTEKDFYKRKQQTDRQTKHSLHISCSLQ